MTDCATPKGQVAIGHERRLAHQMAARWNADVTLTGAGVETDTAVVDALYSRRWVLMAVAEIKWRGASLTLETLRQFGTYLITHRKLQRGRVAARLLHVPLFLIVGLADCTVWWKVAEADGGWCEHPHVERTRTQRSINGGTALRWNAYLSLSRMHVEEGE